MNIDEDLRAGRHSMAKESIEILFEQKKENNSTKNNFILDEALINLEAHKSIYSTKKEIIRGGVT